MTTEFSLLGGPLHRLGARLGLVRGQRTARLGLTLGFGAWLVLVALALLTGAAHQLFSIPLLAVHARLLVAIPLYFLCESWLDPRTSTFVAVILRSGVVPDSARPALDAELGRIRRWENSWAPDLGCLVLTIVWSLAAPAMIVPGVSSALDPFSAATGIPAAQAWYWWVCLPLFRFLTLRILLRLGVWTLFLGRVARLDLRLVPTHPDSAAGVGYLEVVHTHFLPLIFAISVVEAASLAEEISTGAIAFAEIYPAMLVVLVVDVLLFVGPLFLFTPRLWRAKVQGMADYMEFAADYVGEFDRKWLRGEQGEAGELLGTADLQSLADLNNSVAIVRNMRWLPVSFPMLRDYAVAAIVPMLPLYLLKYPIAELAQRFVERLSGLKP